MEPLAEKIRTHPLIQGIPSQDKQHRISLFADDVILTLSDPYAPLTAAHDALLLFSKVAYYKVNASKSSILGIAIVKATKSALQRDLPYPWSPNSITYLGIQFTSPISNLYKANYTPLLSEFQQEISRFQKHYISWNGCLLNFQFPFHLLFFTTMQKQLYNFVWVVSKARFPPIMQRKNKAVSGMGLPVLKEYNIAVILTSSEAGLIRLLPNHGAN